MNRIVRDNYPVADLPEQLREGFVESDHVKVTIEPVSIQPVAPAEMRRQRLEELFAQTRPSFNGLDEIAVHLEELRREWD